MSKGKRKNSSAAGKKDDSSNDPVSILQKLKLQGRAKSKLSLETDVEGTSKQEIYSKDALLDRCINVNDDGLELSNDEMSDWYEDLTDDVMLGFKELFDTLDQAKTGILNADNLYEGLKKIDGDITREEVESVINKLDKDGNGEIDFDEFLFHMTQGLDTEEPEKKRGALSKRQRMFYTALNTMKQIERSYLQPAPHVLSHYTAGARLIGLTDRQLAKQMKKMQKDAKQHDSPYAKPLPFVSQSGSVKTRRNIKGTSRHFSRYKLATERTQIGPDKTGSIFKLGQKQSNLSAENKAPPVPIIENMKLEKNPFNKDNHKLFNSSHRKTIFSKFQNIISNQKRMSIVSEMISFQKKADFDSPEIRLASPDIQVTCENELKLFKPPSAKEEKKTSKSPDSKSGSSGWKSKTVDFDKVPLPVLKIKYKKSRPTIDDLPDIREKATQSISDYYKNLRRATVQNSFEHWERLYADTIRSKKLLENFRTVYRAYSPHKVEETFVVAPWIPGPYRYFRSAGRNNGTTSRQEGSVKGCRTPDITCIKRPFTAC